MYGKLFSTLFRGSMRGKGDLQLTFMYMVINASRDGICDFTPQCIADATGKPLEIINACLKELQSPDAMSRTTTDEGRRIRLLDEKRPWGWQIINYETYRRIGTKQDMREAERLRKQEYRDRKKAETSTMSQDVPDKGASCPGPFASASSSSSCLKEENNLCDCYIDLEALFGHTLGSLQRRSLCEIHQVKGVTCQLIQKAIQEAAERGVRNMKYVRSIVERCAREGSMPGTGKKPPSADAGAPPDVTGKRLCDEPQPENSERDTWLEDKLAKSAAAEQQKEADRKRAELDRKLRGKRNG